MSKWIASLEAVPPMRDLHKQVVALTKNKATTSQEVNAMILSLQKFITELQKLRARNIQNLQKHNQELLDANAIGEEILRLRRKEPNKEGIIESRDKALLHEGYLLGLFEVVTPSKYSSEKLDRETEALRYIRENLDVLVDHVGMRVYQFEGQVYRPHSQGGR